MNYLRLWDATLAIPSGVSIGEGELLYRLSEEILKENTGSVVEIGAYLGKSTIFLSATGLVYSIDHHRGNKEHQIGQPRCRPGTVIDGRVDTYPLYKTNLEKIGLWQNVVPVVTDHITALSYLDASVFPIRLLFIDAEHSYKATQSIIETWIPHIQGYIIFHDYCSDFPEVIRAVDEAQLGEPTFKQDTMIVFDTRRLK